MVLRARYLIGGVFAALFYLGFLAEIRAAAVTHPDNGVNAAAIQVTVDKFRTELGTLNGNVPGSFLTGRREIDWDEIRPEQASPNNITGDYYQIFSPRGVGLTAPVGTTFQISATAPAEFGNINASYTAEFTTFSAARLFTPVGGNVFTITFFVPGTGVPATIGGFGAVFADVDKLAGTKMEFFAPNGDSLGVFTILAQDNGLSFQGITFNAGERVAKVTITLGNKPVGSGNNDVDGINSASDVVVLDDLIYSEPVPYPDAVAIQDEPPGLSVHTVHFNTRTPDTVHLVAFFGGMGTSKLVGIDFRPATGTLYGMGVSGPNGRLVEQDRRFSVSPLGPTITVSGTSFGFDVDPMEDRLRIVSDTEMNISVDPEDGTVRTDGVLEGNPNIIASAYTNNVPGAPNGSSKLYSLDSVSHMLVKHSSPVSLGGLTNVATVTEGGSTLNFTDQAGFDIQPYTDTAYAALTVAGESRIYTIDTDDGEARKISSLTNSIIGGGFTVRGFALVPQLPSNFTPPPSYNVVAVDLANHLVKFNSESPGTTTTVSISGLPVGEQIVELAYRPQDSQLYGLGVTEGPNANDGAGRIYKIDLASGAATQVGMNPFATDLADNAEYGFDADTEFDYFLVTNSADRAFQIGAETGGATFTFPIDHPYRSETVTGLASVDFTPNDFNSATTYGIDFSTDSLVLIGSYDGGAVPNQDVVNTVGYMGVFTQNSYIGFDIAADTGAAFAALHTDDLTRLYNIDLRTGFAFRRGTIGNGMTELRGLAVIPATIRIIQVTRNGSDLIITFDAAKGRTYRLERQLNLTDFAWESPISGVSDVTASADGSAQITHVGALNQPHAFYRLRFVLSP